MRLGLRCGHSSLTPVVHRSVRSIISCAVIIGVGLGRPGARVRHGDEHATPKREATALLHWSFFHINGRWVGAVNGSSTAGAGLRRTPSQDSGGSVSFTINGAPDTVSVCGARTSQNRLAFTPLTTLLLHF